MNDASKVQIKPNVYSWAGIQVANAFYTSFDYNRELDSHMMKNTEWGAVAYLQHSMYGSTTSVRLNNNSDSITGYQANEEPTCGYTGQSEDCNKYCNDDTCNVAYPNSVLSSTTGNITGIYDMSGGVWEYVMAVMEDKNGNPMSGANSNANSGFNGSFGIEDSQLTNGYDWPVQQYYDIYIYDDILYNAHYYNRILGDATGEMGPFTTKIYSESASEVNRQRYLGSWYDDYSSYVPETRVPWIARGSRSVTGLDSGAFAFIGDTGNNYPYTSFRIILTPTK